MPVTLGSSCASTTILWSGPTSWNSVSTSPMGSADAREATGKSRSVTKRFMEETPEFDVGRHSCLLSCTRVRCPCMETFVDSRYAHELRAGERYADLRFQVSAELNQQYL